jgi:hypothetical protein
MSLLRAAWRLMLTERTLPPTGTPWPWPRKALSIHWPGLASGERPQPAAGQIWSLAQRLGGWLHPGRYIHPPLVLVLEVLPGAHLWGAQLFDTPELAGPGDVPLGPGQGLAEAWNTAILPVQTLEQHLGDVSPGHLHAVREAAQGEYCVPEDSGIAAFRLLEADVAQFMVLRSRDLDASAAESTRRRVLRFHPGIAQPEDLDPWRALATATLPPELTAVAAADTPEHIPYTRVLLGEAQEMPCHGFFATQYQRRLDGDTIRITGVLDPAARKGTLYAWWQHKLHLREGVCRLDPHTGMFRADFPGHGTESFLMGRPLLLLVDDSASHAR